MRGERAWMGKSNAIWAHEIGACSNWNSEKGVRKHSLAFQTRGMNVVVVINQGQVKLTQLYSMYVSKWWAMKSGRIRVVCVPCQTQLVPRDWCMMMMHLEVADPPPHPWCFSQIWPSPGDDRIAFSDLSHLLRWVMHAWKLERGVKETSHVLQSSQENATGKVRGGCFLDSAPSMNESAFSDVLAIVLFYCLGCEQNFCWSNMFFLL